MKWVVSIGIFLAVFYIALIGLIYILQRSMLYFPPADYLSPQAVNVPMDEIKNEAGEVVSWWAPPSSERGKVVMVFHGNGSAIYSNYDIFNDFIQAGHGVLSVGYPGYPGQGGKATQTALVDSAVAQYEWILAQGIAADRIAFYGTSLGSGVAAQLTTIHEPSILFVDAPFNSTLDMAKRTIRFAPVGLLMKDTFRSDLALANISVPLIWMHGDADNIVPLSQGQKLYDGYKGPKSAHIIARGQHNNLWALGGREIVLSALKAKD